MRTFGLIGKNIEYSFSRSYFKQKFERENISDAQYVNFDIPHVDDFLKIRDTGHAGYNVTIPYKTSILPFLDDLSPEAQQIGAVNTIKIVNDKYIGYNTDVTGFSQSLKPLLKPCHLKALVLGNGGASKAVVFALKKMNIPYLIAARKPLNGQILFQNIDAKLLLSHQIIINCTPLGTYPDTGDCPPLPYTAITPEHLLYDLIYNPVKTRFLLHGETQHAQIKNGYEMLVLQAEEAWKIWQTAF